MDNQVIQAVQISGNWRHLADNVTSDYRPINLFSFLLKTL